MVAKKSMTGARLFGRFVPVSPKGLEIKVKTPLPEPVARSIEISTCHDPKWLLPLREAFKISGVRSDDLQQAMIASFAEAGYSASSSRDHRIALTLKAEDGSSRNFIGSRTEFNSARKRRLN